MRNFRKMIAAFSMVAMLSTLVVSTAFAGTYTDVPENSSYYAAIETLAAAGVLDATKTTFGGTEQLKRAEAVKLAVLAAGYDLESPATATFTDVAKTAWYYSFVETAAAHGIIDGTKGMFYPDNNLQRSQYAKMLVEGLMLPEYTPAEPTFTDVAATHWSYGYVETAYQWTVIGGYGDGTFKPANPVTRYQASAMTHAGMNPVDKGGAAVGDDDDDDDADTGFDENGGTEGSIDEVTLATADESEALEGQEEVEVYALDVKLEDNGPLQLQRADFYFSEGTASATPSTKPWDYFTEISLAVNGEIIDTIDTSTSTGWGSKTSGMIADANTDNEYRLRFTGLDSTLVGDDTTKVTLLVSVVNSLDSEDEAAEWMIEVSEFRLMDETSFVSTYNTGMNNNGAGFEVKVEMDAAEIATLKYSVAANDVEATTFAVSKTSDTLGVEIYAFEIEETQGVDVNIAEMTMLFTTTGTTVESSVLKKAYLLQDGKVVGSESMVDGGALTFDNLDIDIDGDSTSTFTIEVDVEDTNNGARYEEGSTVAVTVGSITEMTDSMGNDEDDLGADALLLDLDSPQHVLRSEGITVAIVSATTNVSTVDGANNDNVEFTWVVDVTAFGDKAVYVNADVGNILDTADGELNQVYGISYSSGAVLDAVGATISESDADVTPVTGDDTAYKTEYNGESFFKIAKGKTGTFTINVSGTNQTNAKQVRAALTNFEWTVDALETAAAADALDAAMNAYTFQIEDESKTPYKLIN